MLTNNITPITDLFNFHINLSYPYIDEFNLFFLRIWDTIRYKMQITNAVIS